MKNNRSFANNNVYFHQKNLFLDAPCLTSHAKVFSAPYLHRRWFKNSDKRFMETTLQKFIEINKDAFHFLDIQTEIVGSGNNLSLIFSTGTYTGAIPLRSPVNGKQIGDVAIHPRFVAGKYKFGEYVSILNLLNTQVLPEYFDSIHLASSSQLRPPLYFHASEYIRLLVSATKLPWRKFNTISQFSQEPKGIINWAKKFENSFDPKKNLLFNCKYNELSSNHLQVQQLKYVFDLSVTEINSSRTPPKVRCELLPQIKQIKYRLGGVESESCTVIKTYSSDPLFIKNAKKAANDFLDAGVISSKGWRIDFSLVFERFVQHLFSAASKSMGLKFYPNYKFIRIGSFSPQWSLQYLEPDGVLLGDTTSAVIDAKYKAHLYNFKRRGATLSEEHRNDLHQILSYSSFLSSDNILLFLCYPAEELNYSTLMYKNPATGKVNKVIVLGVPLKSTSLGAAKQYVSSLITGK